MWQGTLDFGVAGSLLPIKAVADFTSAKEQSPEGINKGWAKTHIGTWLHFSGLQPLAYKIKRCN